MKNKYYAFYVQKQNNGIVVSSPLKYFSSLKIYSSADTDLWDDISFFYFIRL